VSAQLILPMGKISDLPILPRFQKYCFHQTQIKSTSTAIPCPQEGRIAIVKDIGRVDAAVCHVRFVIAERHSARGRMRLMRTMKSCGPDAATLASGFAATIGLAPTFCWWQIRSANAPSEYNVRVPDIFHVNLSPASFNTRLLLRAIYLKF
jgi:hypothetical protein